MGRNSHFGVVVGVLNGYCENQTEEADYIYRHNEFYEETEWNGR